ncbi:Hypothetical predicted protein, partial [Marmota monax]
ETAALDATEANTATKPQRSPGDNVPTAAVVAAAAANTTADSLPAANNHCHYCCYHSLEDCFRGDSRFGCTRLHPLWETSQGWGPGCQQVYHHKSLCLGTPSGTRRFSVEVPAGLEEAGIFLLRVLVAIVLLLHLRVTPSHECIPGGLF